MPYLNLRFHSVSDIIICKTSHHIVVLKYFQLTTYFLITAISDSIGIPTQYSAEVLTHSSLQIIEKALFDPRPFESYSLSVPQNKFYCSLPCRSEFIRSSKNNSFVQKV